MDELRYILTVQNKNIFKEVGVSRDMPLLKIGTLQDCDVRLKRELFDLPVSLTLRLEGDDWRISCGAGLSISSRDVKVCVETSIHHGDIVAINKADDKASLFTIAFSYDFTASTTDFDTIIDVRNQNRLIIGNTPSAQIKLGSRFAGSEYVTLTRSRDGSFALDATHAPNSATVNGFRVLTASEVRDYDFICIADYSFYFKNQVLYTQMREDLHISGISSQPLRDETPAFSYPKLNRSPRMIYAFDTKPIEILNPPNKPEKPRDNLILQLLPALLMITVMVLFRSGLIGDMNMGSSSFLFMSVAMMSVGIFTSVLSIISSKRRYKKDLAEWRSDYTDYISAKRREIELEQERELAALTEAYPQAETVRDFVKTFSGRLFERTPKDSDFLHVRAGLGAVPALRKPEFNRQEHIKTENELAQIPEQLSTEYALVDNAPVMLNLRESGMVGVVGTYDEQYEFFKILLLDLSVLHDYEEVHTIVQMPRNEQHKYNWLKWIPHIKESGGGIRGIVCDDESSDNVFEYLYALLTARSAGLSAQSSTSPLPHIVIFVLEEYGIKTHPLFKFAEASAALGLSFIFFKNHYENLPQCCAEIVELNSKGGALRLRNDKSFARPFIREQVKDDSIRFVAERLAPVFCEKIALSSRLTASITLFELLNIISPEDLNLIDRWAKSDVQRSLAAPLGIDTKGSQISLDLHEKTHGPHGLVAGTTGSGKSEVMQSYILSAAVNFHPYEVAFVIIDFKGGGMANQFEDLPHLIGKITDIDSHEINRSLLSIRAELEKRKRLFAEFEVNHIDNYIAKYCSGVVSIPLPHLIIIVDEFAELKAEQPDFMKELISAARVGRSLGIHLILATQKPAGQVSEQIWSNSRFKLCLKVATKEDSNEVIKSPLASEIREPGRAYLQVGNNELFTLFQSAYSGASAISDKSGNTREFSISEVSFTGKRTVIFERKAEKTSDGNKLTQLKAMVDYINTYCERSEIKRLPSICLPPLPDVIAYVTPITADSFGATVQIGVYDDPSNQQQPKVELNLSDGNVIIIGSAQMGKTMLLQTILRGLSQRYSPKQASVYVLDFASKVMKVFEDLNHVGGVMTDSDEERLKNFFKMISEEIDSRKEKFSQLGISSFEAYCEMDKESLPLLPRIVVMVDNLSVFREEFQDYEDAMLNICREGLALGVTVIATAKQTSGLSYKYLSNFATRLALNCTESSEYSNVFDRCQLRPKNLQGRGLASIDKAVYEYQSFLPFDGVTESRRVEQVKEFISDMKKQYGTERARNVPSIPPVLTDDYWKTGSFRFDDYVVPVGLTYSEIEPVVIDLAHVGAVGIYGREGFGKNNLLRVILSYLQQRVFDLDCEAYIIDGYDRRLAEFETCGIMQQYTVDCSNFEDIVERLSNAAAARLETLRMGGNLEKNPLLLFVIHNSQIYLANAVSKGSAERFKKLLTDAKQLKICIIISDIENNPEYAPPDIMKIARELPQYFLLDDMANVRLFSSGKFSINDLKPFKKPIVIGDGYSYNPQNGIEKVKYVKCERSN